MTAQILAIGSLLAFFQAVPGVASPPAASARLLAAQESVAPGSKTELAIEVTLAKGWHIYHPISLDAGAPTTVSFSFSDWRGDGPPPATFGPLGFPPPELGRMAGLEYLGFTDSVVILTEMTVGKQVPVGEKLKLSAFVNGIMCKQECVAVRLTAALELPVTAEPGKPANGALFQKARAALPPDLETAAYLKGSQIEISKLELEIGEKAEFVASIRVQPGYHIQDRDPGVDGLIPSRFFIEPIDGVTIGEQVWPEARVHEEPGFGRVRELAGEFKIRAPFSITDSKFTAGPVWLRVLFQYQCCRDGGECYPPAMAEAVAQFRAATSNAPTDPLVAAHGTYFPMLLKSPPKPDDGSAADGSSPRTGLGTTDAAGWRNLLAKLLLAFLGGLILNVMPCVLPVISIKVVSFVQQGGEDPRRVFRLGLAFALGVIAWFWLLALITGLGSLSLRSSLQNPLQNANVVLALGSIVLLMALNLFGVFEVSLPGRAAGALDEVSRREGYPGSFFKGFLATLLGTACTAPILAPALGYAVTQPFGTSLAVFSVAGAGMAAPYLLLSSHPAWLRFIPKPGPWLLVFKQAMGFVLLATALWLLWVLRRQMGVDGVVSVSAFWCFLACAAWLVGMIRPNWERGRALAVWVAALAIAVGGYVFSLRYMYDPDAAAPRRSANAGALDEARLRPIAREAQSNDWKRIPWVPYEPGLASALARLGYTVYVDYTADWCFTCKTNLKLVLETDEVRAAMKRLGVIPIEADYTNNDPQMRADLESFGRITVPLNLVYPAARPDEPIELPVLLTTSTVLEALERAGASKPEGDGASPAPASAVRVQARD